MDNQDKLCIGLDLHGPLPREEYLELWKRVSRLELKMVEKIGECKHCLGDTFIYDTPIKRPDGVCYALLHQLDLYTWRAALGFPSWNGDDPSVYRIHCPDHTGTIWELKRVDDLEPK
jgi:uncharacterized repeat protein (TIGR04076 family)